MMRKDSMELLEEKLRMHEEHHWEDHEHNDIDFDNVFYPTSPENLSRISSIFSNCFLFDYSQNGLNWHVDEHNLPNQSPIDIPIEEVVEYDPKFKVSIHYEPVENVKLEDIEWSVRLKATDSGHLILSDLNGHGPYTFTVDHLHMHGPAEHKINGIQHDLEMHIVNILTDGPDWHHVHENLAVVSIIFKIAEHSHPFVEKLRVEDMGRIDQICFTELFNVEHGDEEAKSNIPFMHYKGSLTNPPCTNIVNWIVYKEVLPISEIHLKTLRGMWHTHLGGHYNYRECQPLADRKIVKNFVD